MNSYLHGNLKFEKIIRLLFLLFLPFQNTSLQAYGGILFSSPSFFFLAILLLMDVCRLRFKLKPVPVLIFILFSCISISWMLYYGLSKDISFLIDRGSRLLILWGMYLYAFRIGLSLQLGEIRFVGAFWILLIGLSLLLPTLGFTVFDGTSIIQYTENTNMRPRGLTMESSVFGVHIFILLSLAAIAYGFGDAGKGFLLLSIISGFVFLSQSKGGSIAAILGIFVAAIALNRTAIKKLTIIIASILFIYFFGEYIKSVFIQTALSTIEDSTSIATRSTMAILSIKSLSSLFGVGPFGYLPYIYENGLSAMDDASRVLPFGGDFSEVRQYFNYGEVSSVSTKSAFFDWTLAFGIPFIGTYLFLFYKMFSAYAKQDDVLRLGLLVFIFIATIFYVSSFGDYLIPVATGFLYSTILKGGKKGRALDSNRADPRMARRKKVATFSSSAGGAHQLSESVAT